MHRLASRNILCDISQGADCRAVAHLDSSADYSIRINAYVVADVRNTAAKHAYRDARIHGKILSYSRSVEIARAVNGAKAPADGDVGVGVNAVLEFIVAIHKINEESEKQLEEEMAANELEGSQPDDKREALPTRKEIPFDGILQRRAIYSRQIFFDNIKHVANIISNSS